MIFEENKTIEKAGEKLGYIFSYFLFTTIIFFMLALFKKIGQLSYFHAMAITALVVLTGIAIGRFLK